MVSLRRNVLMTVAGIATVAVSLSLFGGILMLSKWVDHGTEKIKGGVTLEIFMNVKATRQQIDAVEANLKDAMKPGGIVESYRHLSKTDAYDEFKRIFRRDPDLVSTITAEDLPESFRVAPRKTSGGPDVDKLTSTLQQEFQSQQGVDKVSTPGDTLKGLVDVTNTVRLIFIGISAILLLSSLFLIVNTIRLATFARHREIEVMKLSRRVELVRARAVPRGRHGAGPRRRRGSRSSRCSRSSTSASTRRSATATASSPSSSSRPATPTRIAFIVLIGGMLIGTFGAVVGLRRFLRT